MEHGGYRAGPHAACGESGHLPGDVMGLQGQLQAGPDNHLLESTVNQYSDER
jgi:hypothetical protein